MKISISTLKLGKVYNILYAENPQVTGVSKSQFQSKVEDWIPTFANDGYSAFTAVEPDLYSMIIVTDINNGHDAPQQEIEI